MIQRCQHPDENWLCLCCKEVLCSRFVNKHMLEHYQQEHHNLALSYRFFLLCFFWDSPFYVRTAFRFLFCFFPVLIALCWLSDLSVWCFSCDAYLDAQVMQPLRAPYETAYILKFGSAPPLRAIEPGQNVDMEANASVGNWCAVLYFL